MNEKHDVSNGMNFEKQNVTCWMRKYQEIKKKKTTHKFHSVENKISIFMYILKLTLLPIFNLKF